MGRAALHARVQRYAPQGESAGRRESVVLAGLVLVLTLAAGWLPTAAGAQAADAAPSARAEARVVPGGNISLGATAHLQVDVLTSTWFTQPPQLPSLQLPGVLVTAPGGEAELLSLSEGGVAYTGLRYTYLLSPTRARPIAIPPLAITVQLGQGSGPVRLQTPALTIAVDAPLAAAPDGTPVLLPAASALHASQLVTLSAQPLKVGDSMTRQLVIRADGAQAMLIPPVNFEPVAGLRRYVQEPVVTRLTDGRGGFVGGQRVDTASYVVATAGTYRLPAITLRWWNTATRREESLQVPEQTFEAAAAATYRAPFSVAADLRMLQQSSRLYLPRAWLSALAMLAGAGALAWLARPWWRRAASRLRLALQAAMQAWRLSEACAWRALRRELARPQSRLDALYRWIFRLRRVRTLDAATATATLAPDLRRRMLDVLRDCYGEPGDRQAGLSALRACLQPLRRQLRAQTCRAPLRYALAPLNPRRAEARGPTQKWER